MSSSTSIRLRAADACKGCGGKGFFYESHGNSMWGGEQIPCDCLWENDGIDYDDPKIAGMIDRGDYEILPSYALEQAWEDDIESEPN